MDKFCASLVYARHTDLLIETEKKWFENKVFYTHTHQQTLDLFSN